MHAAQHPVALDYRAAAAVSARIELDLRIGAAFTRFQTLMLQERIAVISADNMVVSYGSSSVFRLLTCQVPVNSPL